MLKAFHVLQTLQKFKIRCEGTGSIVLYVMMEICVFKINTTVYLDQLFYDKIIFGKFFLKFKVHYINKHWLRITEM